ncbi:MAG: hypothetical protein ACYC3Q_05205 [Gemmatimonadaceae bacterium]
MTSDSAAGTTAHHHDARFVPHDARFVPRALLDLPGPRLLSTPFTIESLVARLREAIGDRSTSQPPG